MRNWVSKVSHLAAIVSLVSEAQVMAQAFPITSVQFDGDSSQIVQFRGAQAVAYNAEGEPIFQGSRDFILKAAASTAGNVLVWDVTHQRVRISPSGAPQLWIACADLQPMSIACSTSFRISSDGALVIGGASATRKRGTQLPTIDPVKLGRLPNCPGDPRCP